MTLSPRSPHDRGRLTAAAGGKVALLSAVLARYVVAPALGAVAAVHAAITLGEGGETTEGITNPDVPRCLTVKGSAASCTGNVVIAGTNIAGKAITETFALSGTSTVTGSKAFRTVTSITYPPDSGATGESIQIGTSDKLGMPDILRSVDVYHKLFDGSTDAGTLTVDADEIEKNVYAPAGTLDGTKEVEIAYFAW